jgi:hypothetical protein
VRDFVGMLGRLHIRCDLEKRDTVYYATHPESADRRRREFGLRCKAGFEGDWLTSGALRRLTGIPGRGAIRTRGSAQFNPYRCRPSSSPGCSRWRPSGCSSSESADSES